MVAAAIVERVEEKGSSWLWRRRRPERERGKGGGGNVPRSLRSLFVFFRWVVRSLVSSRW